MVIFFIFFCWVGLKLSNYRKTNYRTKDGQRLTAEQYKKRRKFEIIFHLSLLAALFIAIICLIGTIAYKAIHKPDAQAQEVVETATDSATAELTIVDTIVEDMVIEEDNPYLKSSEDSASFFNGYEITIDDNTKLITSDNVQSSYGVLVDLDSGNSAKRR